MRRESTLQERLRAWWLNRQGLSTRSSPKTIEACVRQSGWMVTAGSAGVYLSIRARMPGVSREAVDRAVLDGLEVLEIPGAHARPWVLVPHDDAAVALRLHLTSSEAHVAAYYRYSGMTEAATKGVAAQICRALDEGPQSSADLRSRITHPDAGELLVGALLHLALRGTVRRLSVDGRLDSGAYVYELRHPDDWPDSRCGRRRCLGRRQGDTAFPRVSRPRDARGAHLLARADERRRAKCASGTRSLDYLCAGMDGRSVDALRGSGRVAGIRRCSQRSRLAAPLP